MVKVLDLGVAKPLAGSDEVLEPDAEAADTEIGVLVGTIGYLSPEQLLGERPEVSWDLWALAADRSARPSSAAEFFWELESALA